MSVQHADSLKLQPSDLLTALTHAKCLLDAFERSGSLDIVQAAIIILEPLVEQPGITDHMSMEVRQEVGRALRGRAFIGAPSAANDLQRALDSYRQILLHYEKNPRKRVEVLKDIAETQLLVHAFFEDEDYLRHAVAALTEAWSLSGADDNRQPDLLYLFSLAKAHQAVRSNAPSGLRKEAEEHARGALTFFADDHPRTPFILSHLASLLVRRSNETGDTLAKEDSNRLARRAVQLCGQAHPCRAQALSALSDICYRWGEEVIHFSVDCAEEALALRSLTHPLRRHALQRKARTLSARAIYTGCATDHEAAINLQREALRLCPATSLSYGPVMSDLAFFIIRLSRSKSVYQGVEEAVYLLRSSLKESVAGPPPALRYSNLGLALECLHNATGALDPLYEAVVAHEQAVQLGNVRHSGYKWWLDRLAGTLHLLYRRTGDRKTLRQTVDTWEQVLQLWPVGHESREVVMCNLAEALTDDMSLGDLDASAADRIAKLLDTALCLSPPKKNSRSRVLLALSKLYAIPKSPYFNLDRALDFLVYGVSDESSPVNVRMVLSLERLKAFSNIHGHSLELREKLLDAYRLVTALLPRLAYLGLKSSDRLRILHRARDLASVGAVHALSLAQTKVAVELLEEGHAVFWSQFLQTKTPLDDLPGGLASEIKSIIRRLSDEGFTGEDKRILMERFDKLVLAVRSIPTFDRFMLSETLSSLSSAASEGPVAILIADQSSCYAIIMRAGSTDATRLHLPDITLQDLKDTAASTDTAIEQNSRYTHDQRSMKVSTTAKQTGALSIYGQMWNRVMKPIVNALQVQVSVGRQRPRLFICATRAFSRLPLHAAGAYDNSNPVGLSNYLVPTYIFTLGSLIAARSRLVRPERAATRMLLAHVPRAFQGRTLPFTSNEIKGIRGVIPAHPLVATSSAITDGQVGASAQDVLDGLEQATIVHIASHGHQDRIDPLQSGFIMRDRMLTVSELMKLDLPQAFFAFLSACETARGDEKQPDQAVHLAAAMFFAGFKSVIGTMWSMNDVDGPAVATSVYRELFSGDSRWLDPKIIPYALDDVVQGLRREGMHPTRWGTYVHFGI